MYRLSIIILLFFRFNANGQTSVYHPFPDSNAVWNIYNYSSDPYMPSNCVQIGTYSYFMQGDTLINSNLYHKIFVPFFDMINNQPNLCNHFYPIIGYAGAIRQEIQSKKVWVVFKDSLSETLLYDFSLTVGDTMHLISQYCPPEDILVTQIDSILLDGNYRKVLSNNHIKIIEGIGSINGLFEASCRNFSPIWNLTCFRQNGNTVYPDSVTNCELITLVPNSSNQIYSIIPVPNPFHVFTRIKIPNYYENIGLTISIYDVYGKLHRILFVDNSPFILHRENLSSGIYFFRIRNNKENIASGKFVIN